MIKPILLALAVLPALVAGNTAPEPELLYGFSRNDGALHFLVMSRGCTLPAHFEPQIIVDGQGDDVPHLRLVRKQPDNCRRKPQLVNIQFNEQSLRLEQMPVIVDNPFQPHPGQTERIE